MIVALLLFLLAQPDTPADAAHREMQKLPALEGTWEGSGWMRMGPGEPVKFVGRETVESRLDRRVILIEGKHFTPDRETVVHHAFAMLTWDERAGEYRFRTQLANGRAGDFPGSMEDGAFVWRIDTPAGPMRYVIRIDGDTWHEVGFVEREGKSMQTFEMTLTRAGE